MKHLGPLTALEVLSEVLVTWLAVWSGGGRVLPDDGKSLTYAIGHRVMALRPAGILYSAWIDGRGQVISRRQPGGLAARLLGHQLREVLTPYLSQAYVLLEERRMVVATQQNRMRTPLRQPKPEPATAPAAPTVVAVTASVVAPRPPVAPAAPAAPTVPPAPARMTAEDRLAAYAKDREAERK